MGYLNIPGIEIKGFSACVPKNKIDNIDLPFIHSEEEAENLYKKIGNLNRQKVCSP